MKASHGLLCAQAAVLRSKKRKRPIESRQVLAALTVEGARPAEKADELARARQAKKAEQQKISEEIKTWLQNDGKDWFTAAQAKVAKSSVVFSFSRGEAANVLQRTGSRWLLAVADKRSSQGRTLNYFTFLALSPKRPWQTLFLCSQTIISPVSRSTTGPACVSRMSPGSSRMLNLRTIAEAYRHKPIGVARGARSTRKRPRTIAMPSSPRNS